jgi:hypothetical protein
MPRPAHFQLLPILMLLCRMMSGTTAPGVAMPAPLHSLLTGACYYAVIDCRWLVRTELDPVWATPLYHTHTPSNTRSIKSAVDSRDVDVEICRHRCARSAALSLWIGKSRYMPVSHDSRWMPMLLPSDSTEGQTGWNKLHAVVLSESSLCEANCT